MQLLKLELSMFLNYIREEELAYIASRIMGAPQSYTKTLVRKCADRAEGKLLRAKSFFRPSNGLELMPCPNGFPGSVNVGCSQVPNNLRVPPPIVYDDFLECLGKTEASFKDNLYDVQRYINWKKSLGTANLICELFPEQ